MRSGLSTRCVSVVFLFLFSTVAQAEDTTPFAALADDQVGIGRAANVMLVEPSEPAPATSVRTHAETVATSPHYEQAAETAAAAADLMWFAKAAVCAAFLAGWMVFCWRLQASWRDGAPLRRRARLAQRGGKRSWWDRLRAVITYLLVVTMAFGTAPARAVDGFWILDANGNWVGTPANWSGDLVPDGVDDTASFTNDITAGRTITLNAPVTLGGLTVGDALGGSNFVFTGANALTFDVTSGNAFWNKINSATYTWQAPLVLNDDLDMNVYAGTLDINGVSNAQVSLTGTGDLIKNGAGALRMNINTAGGYTGDWVLNLGTLSVSGAASGTPTQLGTGTGGIRLNGSGIASLSIFGLYNNGSGANGTAVYDGNNDVFLQGAARIDVNRNVFAGANSNVVHVLDNLTMNGGILEVTGGNGHQLRFAGTTTLAGQTSVFAPSSAILNLAGPIVDGLNSRAFIMEGSGRVTVTNNANAYDGVTAVKAGSIQLGAGANLGTGAVYVNGGALTLSAATQLTDGSISGGVNLVAQLGTSRYSVGAIGINSLVGDIDFANPLAVNVPIAGMALAIDSLPAVVTSNIDLSQVGVSGGGNRVWVTNLVGGDRTFSGMISAAADGAIRVSSPGSTFILNAGGTLGAGALIVGFDHATPININTQGLTGIGGGTVSVRADNINAGGLVGVRVHRNVTLNINGNVISPIGSGEVVSLGGNITTDNASAAAFANQSFMMFGGSTLLLDNSAVTTANVDRRLSAGTQIVLTGSTLRFIGDGGGAGVVATQAIDRLTYYGGSTISIDTDGTGASRRAEFTAAGPGAGLGSFAREGRATLNFRNTANTATTFGTAAGTQKFIIAGTAAPTPNNGMIGANMVLWGGTTSNDAGDPFFVNHDAVNGIERAVFTHTSFAGTTTASIVNINGAAVAAGTQSVQALRIRSTANTHAMTAGTVTIGAAAAAGQGAGLFLAHTSNNGVNHGANFAFGAQEGLIYAATTGGTSGSITLSGVLSGTGGITRFGDGILILSGANTFTGGLQLNSGETRVTIGALGTNDVDVWGGNFQLNTASRVFNNRVTFYHDGRFGNFNVGGSGIGELRIAERNLVTDAPVVVWVQNSSGGNFTTVHGNLVLDGSAQLSIAHGLQINGAITGVGALERYYNERLFIGGDSSGYSAPITVWAGTLASLNGTASAKPFGTGAITINPGGTLRLAAPTNVDAGQVTLNSDLGGISGLGLTYSNDLSSLPAVTVNSTAPWKAFIGVSGAGFRADLDQSSAGLWGGNVYLGSTLGDTGVYTGVLAPNDAGRYLLGTGQGTVRIGRTLGGAGNSAVIGLSMTGNEVGRADQVVNNSGGVVQYDVPMTYDGTTTINVNTFLRISAFGTLDATGDLLLNGGFLQADSNTGNFRMITPQTVSNDIIMTADSSIQMQNQAGDFVLTGDISLALGSTGVVRQLNVGADGSSVGNLILEGGIVDGAGSSGNHFIKAGYATLFLRGTNTYGGTTTVTGGLLGVNSDADFGNSTHILLPGGGLGIFEDSFTSSRNISFHGGNGWLDVRAGLTFTQAASSTYDGTSFIMKRGLGTVILNGQNAQTGIWIGDGVLQVNSQQSLGNSAEAGATAIQFGGDFTPAGGSNSRHTGGTLRINADMTTLRGITFNNNAATAYSGGIDVTAGNTFTAGGVLAQGTEFDFAFKTGEGTLVTNSSNISATFTTTVNSVNVGTGNTSGLAVGMQVTGTGIAAGATIATITGPTTFTLSANATASGATSLTFVNDNINLRQFAMTEGTLRFSNSTPWRNSTTTAANNTVIEMLGGVIHAANTGANIALLNAASTTTYNYGGGLHLRFESGAGFSAEFNADNLIRVNQGTLVLETVGGTLLGGVGASDAGRLLATNMINTGTARATAVTNGMFAAHIVAADATGTARFTTDDATTGIAVYGGPVVTSLLGLDPTAIADISTAQLLAGETSVYALRTAADVSGGLLRIGAVDNIRSGGILFNATSTISSDLIFDPTSAAAPGTGLRGEAILYVKQGETASLTGTVLAGALTKFGGGVLVLGNDGEIYGDVAVQEGVLRLDGPAALSRLASDVHVNAGATLDLNGNSVRIDSLTGNQRQVAGVNIGGRVTNDSAAQAVLGVTGFTASTFTGTIEGNLTLHKSGINVLTLDGYRVGTPASGNNTFTGGVEIYGYNTVGGINIQNAPFALGGYGGATTGDVNLYNGTLGLLYSGNWLGIPTGTGPAYNNHVIKIGAENTLGVTLNVKGPGLVNVAQAAGAAVGLGNIMQIGDLNMSDALLTMTGGSFNRLRIAGTTTILGAQASFQTNSDGPSGSIEFFGKITGAGALNKYGDGTMRGIIIANSTNDYAGGTNIIAGDISVTAVSGTALGTGPVRVFPDGTLRVTADTSVDGSQLTVMSRVNALGAVALTANFNPTFLTPANFGSVYNTTLQLSQPYFTQTLDLATIGDGRAFLGSGLAQEVRYMGQTLGAGVADAWNPGVGVYRLVGGVNNLSFDGVDNVLTGDNYLQLGPQRNNILGAATNTGNGVLIRNSNDYAGGTQIAEGTILYIETGGSPIGETPLGTGAVEIYGQLRVQGSLGSLWKADANAGAGGPANTINLRPGGFLYLIEGNAVGTGGSLVAGGQGRWGDNVPLDLNGGQFRYDGAANWTSVETIGDVTVRKGSIISVFRNSNATSTRLNVASLNRAERGVLTLNYNTGFLGNNITVPESFERLVVAGGMTVGGTTSNGAGVTNGGIVAPWIIDRVTNSFVGYDPTGATTGFQPLISSLTPGAGLLGYSKIVSGTFAAATLNASDVVDVTTNAKTLASDVTVYAMRSNQNISPGGASDSITVESGGLILTGGTINPFTAATGVLPNMTLDFGAGGAGEALIYVGAATSIIQAQINAAQGLTKFGPNQLQIHTINPGIGGDVVIHEGTLYARIAFSGSGSAVGKAFNGQHVVLNGGALVIDGLLADDAGISTMNASDVRSTAVLGSSIFVRGDATLGNNGQAVYQRINDLTIANSAGSAAMNGNGVITLVLQSGIWVTGTTTLAPEAKFNSTFNGFAQSTFAGQVTGAGGIDKFGNGTITLLSGANDYAGGTVVNGTTIATAVSTVASAYRGAGTPFGTGPVTVNPGGLLRIADNANIASNPVTLKSDGYGLAGLGIAHNGPLPTIVTAGSPAAGEVKLESTGPFSGVIALDYGYYDRGLDVASIPGGNWYVGNSQQAESFYFNASLGAAANGRYLLGGGGNQNGVSFGSVFVSGGRTTLFENIFTGGAAGQVRMEIGALTADLFANGPSMVNGNAGFVVLAARNVGLTGDVRVNTNSTLAVGNNFALGSGRLVLNGGNLRYDFGPNNFVTSSITLNNDVLLTGDFSTSSGNDLVWKGDVAMHDGGAGGATRIWNLTGSGTMGVYGVISGADGSNIIKRGAQNVVFAGVNTYQGYTQIDRGSIIVAGDVLPGVAGPLGNSFAPITLGVEGTNLAGSLGIGGKFTIGRDILVTGAAGTGLNQIESRTLQQAVVTGAISIVSGGVLTLGSASLDVTTFRGGSLDVQGPISGSGRVTIGTTAVAPANSGTVRLSAQANGYGANTYSGGTTLNSARLTIASDTYYSGPADAPVIISGPLGTGTFTFGAGESNRGGVIEAAGGPRTILNAITADAVAATHTYTFAGREALTFTSNFNINSDATLRSRVFTVHNLRTPVTFAGNLSNSGAQGSNLVKNGGGLLVLSGVNSNANLLTTDANYGTAMFVDAGVLRVASDASLGSTASLAVGGSHTIAGPADLRLRGGFLSTSASFATSRILINNNDASGIDVNAGTTLAWNGPIVSGSNRVTKTGRGELALNNAANAILNLTLGGAAQADPTSGRYHHTGGLVSTTALSGTPLVAGAAGTLTINGGAVLLDAAGGVQAISVARFVYGASAGLMLSKGTNSTALTASESAATAFQRGNVFNGVAYGTLTIMPSSLANLGVGGEQFLITAAAAQPANFAGTGGNILAVPSIFVRQPGAGQDADFARYDAANGFLLHNVATVNTLATPAAGNVADIASAATVGTIVGDIIQVAALRTSANIAGVDPSAQLWIGTGGLIFNGGAGSTIDVNTLFGIGPDSNLAEALVYVRDDHLLTPSSLVGGVTARDFTKTGGGNLLVGGTANFLNSDALRLPVLSVQDGSFAFASAAALFRNQLRGAALGDYLGHFALNVNELGVFDVNGFDNTVGALLGNGTVTNNGLTAAALVIRNGVGVDTTFAGGFQDGASPLTVVKTQNGTLTLTGHSTHTGGTRIQSGRVTVGTGITTAQGIIDARNMTALGAGPVHLEGGALYVNNNILEAEVVDGVGFNTFGPGNGYDFIVSSTAFTNGVALPANLTSVIGLNSTNTVPATGVSNIGINSLTINAPRLTVQGFASTGANRAALYVKNTTTFADDTELRIAGRVQLILGGKIDAAGKTITKIGFNGDGAVPELVITNSAGGAQQNEVGLWRVYGGVISPRAADGAANPLGANAVVEINGGSTNYGILFGTDGNGTTLAQRILTYQDTTVRYGSLESVSGDNFVSSSSSRISVDRVVANNSNKTVVIAALQVGGVLGSPYVYTTSGNGDSLWVEGTTTFTRDMYLQNDARLTLNGVISGNGTFNKRAGSDLFINADNTSGYKGGTILSIGGTTYLGSFEGNQVTLNDTAKLGPGNIIINSLSAFQINSAGNLQAGQAIYVGANLNDYGMLRLAANLSLEQVNLHSVSVGGIQPGAANYYVSASNPSAGVLSLNTVYTHALDLSMLGDGMWYLGSSTNGVGANGAYEAATLAPGLGNTYRLGAGGATLFFGTSGNSNVLTDYAGPTHLVVGAPMSVQNNNPQGNGIGAVVLMTSQNYTGGTWVNRNSTLDFRGTMATSGFEVYGILNVAGEAGTFLAGGSGANIPVALRPGSTLRFDNTSAGVLPVSAAQGRWEDSVGITLTDSILRLQGNPAVEVAETVGTITAGAGGGQIHVVRGVVGRGVELRTPEITRTAGGTVRVTANTGQLGGDERIIVTGAAPTVTNGMVAPWMVSVNDVQFLTYNADTGFTIAGFNRVTGASTLTTNLNSPASRAYINGNVVLNAGVDYSVHALRLDANVTLGTASDNTAQIILGSGGLISNSTRTVTAGIVAGSIATPSELILYNNGTTTIGDATASVRNVQGQILATSITKFGVGQLALRADQQSFTGDIHVQAGSLSLWYANGTETNPVSKAAGAGGTIYMEGAGTTLFLRGGQNNLTGNVFFENNVMLGDYVPIVNIDVDRFGGSITGRANVIAGNFTFGANNAETGQILRFRGVNDMLLQIGDSATDTLTLVGKSVIDTDNGFNGNDGRVFVSATTTGTGTLVKGPIDGRSDALQLQNVTTFNDWSGGTVVMGGTLRIFAKSENNAAAGTGNMTAGGISTGPITLLGGVLDLRTDVDAGEQAGTYVQAGTTTVTITRNSHGYANGNVVTIPSGPLAGTYAVSGVATNTFNITVAAAGTVPAGTPITFLGADANLERAVYQSAGTLGPDIFVNGSTQINVDRTGLVGQGSNKMVVLGNLTIGQQILTVTGGNGYGVDVAGTTTLQGNMFLNNSAEFVLTGAILDEGAGLFLNKNNTGTLWINSNNNTSLAGGAYINAGLLAFGDRLTGNTTATLGTGILQINPGAQIQVRSAANINTGDGQQVYLVGTAYAPSIFRSVVSFSQADYQAMIQMTPSSSNRVTVIAFEGGTLNQDLDQSLIGDGRVFFGNIGDRTLAGNMIIPGLPNLPDSVVGGGSTNNVYRFGGGSGNTLLVNLAGTGNLTDFGGGVTDVQIGSPAQLGPSGNLFSGFVYFLDQNTYTGQTIVSRGSTLRTNQVVAAGDVSGGFGSNGAANIDIYGALRLENGSSMRSTVVTTENFYAGIKFHPGSLLVFQDVTNAAASNRWGDDTAVDLDGASIQVVGINNATTGVNASETVGAVNFDRGTRIFLNSQGTFDAALMAASLNRAAAGPGPGTGHGTMVFNPTASARLGLIAAASNNAEQVLLTTAPTASAVSAVAGMLPGYFIEGQAHRFVTYGAGGITPVADGSMVPFTAGMTAGDAVVNVTAATTLPDFNPVIYALRGTGNFALNSPTGANNDATITFGGSGADVGSVISTTTTFTINPNLRFGAAGTNEALFYAGGNLRANGFITAGSVTKFGTGTLEIGSDQSDSARGVGQGYSGGWVINEGNINLLTFGSAGNADASNTIVLNGNRATTPTLFLRAPSPDSLLNYTYTSGRIIAVDNGNIDWDPGADDRVHKIADLEIVQSGGIGAAAADGSLDAVLRVAHNRNRTILAAGTLHVTNNAILNVDGTAGPSSFVAFANTSTYLTVGTSSGMSVAALNGSARLTKWGDGYLYVRGASPTFSGNMVIDQGAVHVTHNQSLGTGNLTINRYGILDVGVADFVPTNATVTYNEGSVERWSVDGARSGNLDLGKATLQVAADQFNTNATVTLNGGSIEAWLRTDDITSTNHSGGVFRNLGPNVSVVLAASSFLGAQYYLGANGLDNGRQPNNDRPAEEYAGSGAILDVKGIISETGGPQSLTKVGYDTVILSNHNTYTGGTVVTGGTLRVGIDDALSPTGDLSTKAAGVFDLNGYDQTVRKLVNPLDPTTVGTNGGYVTNSAAYVRTLSVGNGTTTSDTFWYHGVIQHNVALAKIGGGTLVLWNDNTYGGGTVVADGVLEGMARVAGGPFGTGGFTMSGGRLLLTGIDAATNTATSGPMTVTATSQLAINGSANSAAVTQFTVGSLVQQNGAGLILVPFNGPLGPANVKERITVTDTAGLLAGGIVPWVFGATSPFDDTLNLVTLSGNDLVYVSPAASTSIDVPNAGPSLAYVAALGNDNNLDSNPNWGSVQVNSDSQITTSGGFTLTIGDGTAGTLLLNGGTAIASGVNLAFDGPGSIVAAGSFGSIVAGNIVAADDGLMFNGAQPITLSGTNSYAGPTIIQSALLVAGSAGALPSTTAVSLADDAASGLLLNFSSTVGSLAGGGATGGNVTIGANTFTVGNAADTTYAGSIVGAGTVIKQGSGTLTLTGLSGHTGVLQLNAGAVSVASEAALGADSGVFNAGALTFNGGTLRTTATMTIDDVNRGLAVYASGGTVDVASGTVLTIANPVAGGGGNFTKAGTGTLTFTGNNSHPFGAVGGTVMVNTGTMNGNGNFAGQLTVQNNAAFSSGSDSDGVDNHGVGAVSFASADWQDGARFVFDFGATTGTAGTDWDLINIGSGGLNLSGAGYTLNIYSWNLVTGEYGTNDFQADVMGTPIVTPEDGPDAAYRWLWVDNAGSLTGAVDGVLTQFNVEASPGVFAPGSPAPYGAFGGGSFWVSSFGGDLYINYAAVPEPGSLLLLGIAGLGLAGYRRRKRRDEEAAAAAEAAATAIAAE